MVDLSFLEKFTKGNIDKMKRYISMYLSMAPDTFERMNKNLASESWHELAVYAHSLKPQADFMGITSLKEVLIDIENKIKANQTDTLEELVKNAQFIHTESEIYLRRFLENN